MKTRLALSPDSPVSPVLWFAVLGAPLAWVAQIGIGYWLAEAQCSPTGSQWGIPIDAWGIVVGALAAVVAVAAGGTAIALFRSTAEEEHEGPPPGGRVNFLSIVGMAVAPLFLCLIAMTLAGMLVLFPCNQS